MQFGGDGAFYGSGPAGSIGLYNVDTDNWQLYQPASGQSDGELPPAKIIAPGLIYINSSTIFLFGGVNNANHIWLLGGQPSDTTTLSCPYIFDIRAFQGSMMFIAWGILLPIGILIARYTKNIGPKDRWFKLHRVIQSIGLLCSIGGFVAAIIMVTSGKFSIAHHFIGIVVFALGLQQPFNAVIRPHIDASNPRHKTRSRTIWEFLHKNLGRLAVILGGINIFIGLKLIRAPFGAIIGVAIWDTLLIGVVNYMELSSNSTQKPERIESPRNPAAVNMSLSNSPIIKRVNAASSTANFNSL